MADRFISMDEVIDRISFSKTHIYRKIAAGSFPRPVPLGPHKIAFLEREIEQWMALRLDARDAFEGVHERKLRAARAAKGTQ
ncbi:MULTISPECIES: helix-turn-helix transcriptional regulator [unclassified Mesorhizobium]|uniref:helix-turn-helix transcriptional regulator n=1 Tax=unclassified Mesorhizobium TaxID=325217 RepID=UPI0003D03012|nr:MULTISPECIES: AlpA family transcriptional regulator [unclassified Mesorhizobium]ESZ05285.1 dipicolinate synthase [Mesorhizobium sp. L2C089B000]WJI49322.1 AlpA family transcriptional regulator [Mesorhizobium sp. C089B]